MTNKCFDILKRIQRFLPAVSVFLATILTLYRLSAEVVAIVVGTVDAFAVLLGAFLEVSTAQYNKHLELIHDTNSAWDDSYLEEGDNHGEDR